MKKTLAAGSGLIMTFIAATTLVAPPAPAQSSPGYEYDWGVGLMERFGYFEMAEKVFNRLAASSDRAEKIAGELGLGRLYRRKALATSEVGERNALNAKALEKLRAVAKEIPTSDNRHYEALFDVADMRQEIASEAIEQVQRGMVPPDKVEEFLKDVANGLEEASLIYERIKARFETVSQKEDETKWLFAQRAALNGAILHLRKAELIAVDPKKIGSVHWQLELTEAKDRLDEFIWNNDGNFLGLHGNLWMGRVKAQLVKAKSREATVDDVLLYWLAIPEALIFPPPEDAPENWRPATKDARDLVERAYFWTFEFLNELGQTSRVVELGEKYLKDWTTYGYEFGAFGRLALVELAKAYHRSGQSDRALELTASVSDGPRDYAKRQADTLTSVIIQTSQNVGRLSPKIIAAGANGAFHAGRSDETNRKNFECIELYRIVLENLDQIEDPVERNDLGALAWYRIGTCLYRLDRLFEAEVAFRNGYKKFNTDQLNDDPKLPEQLKDSWLFIVRALAKATGNSDFAKKLRTEAENWVIANPPKGGSAGDALQLAWNHAMTAYRQKKYRDALAKFEEIAKRPSEKQERAIVKVAQCRMKLLPKNATPEDWVQVAQAFLDYQEFTRKNALSDPERIKQRREALADAAYSLARCYQKAAELEKDPTKKRAYYERVLAVSEGFDDMPAGGELKQFVRFYRFQALSELDRWDEAEVIAKAMLADEPDHPLTRQACLNTASHLRKTYRKMPVATEEQRAKKRELMARAADYYRRWLVAKKPKKMSYWTLVYNIYYDLGRWEEAQELIDMCLARFEGSRAAKEKDIFFAKRKKARCLLERAKKAYNDEKVEESKQLFNEASRLYDELLNNEKSPVRKAVTVLAEAAEIYGGFLVGPNRHGQYSYFPGNGEFQKAQEAWAKVSRKMKGKIGSGDNEEENLAIENDYWKARFYTFLMEFKIAQTENNSTRLRKLKANLGALFEKSGDRPGGDAWTPKFRWLRDQL